MMMSRRRCATRSIAGEIMSSRSTASSESPARNQYGLNPRWPRSSCRSSSASSHSGRGVHQALVARCPSRLRQPPVLRFVVGPAVSRPKHQAPHLAAREQPLVGAAQRLQRILLHRGRQRWVRALPSPGAPARARRASARHRCARGAGAPAPSPTLAGLSRRTPASHSCSSRPMASQYRLYSASYASRHSGAGSCRSHTALSGSSPPPAARAAKHAAPRTAKSPPA